MPFLCPLWIISWWRRKLIACSFILQSLRCSKVFQVDKVHTEYVREGETAATGNKRGLLTAALHWWFSHFNFKDVFHELYFAFPPEDIFQFYSIFGHYLFSLQLCPFTLYHSVSAVFHYPPSSPGRERHTRNQAYQCHLSKHCFKHISIDWDL